MRLIVISDTHGFHKQLTIPDGDVLIHAGDFSMRANMPVVTEFASWFKTLPHKHKIITAGNHDMACEANRVLTAETFGSGVHYLVHQSVQIEGLNFFASPYSVAIHDPSPWCFDYQRDSTRARKLWDAIPTGTDVLITHGPPKGILDLVSDPYVGEDPNVGDVHLLRRVMEVKPNAHFFGHIHEGYGLYIHPISPRTMFYNVSVCNVNYRPVNPITVFDM